MLYIIYYIYYIYIYIINTGFQNHTLVSHIIQGSEIADTHSTDYRRPVCLLHKDSCITI